MSTAITVAQGLVKIFELREAIRHQRRVNKQTYLQLTEIHVELQFLEKNGPLQDNAMLRRNATVKKFALAVGHFSRYLQKYNEINPFIRFFKRSDMEDERLQIVAEIDQLFRMLGLATSVTVMNGNTVASSNAAKFLSKLEDVHTDVKLTHDQVQAALLGLVEKRKNDETEKKLVVQKPVLQRSSAPAMANYVPTLMETLASCQPAEKEQTLLSLIRHCVTSDSRVQVYHADGIELFARLIRESDSFFTQLYALHCLSWFTFSHSKMSDTEFDVLHSRIREAAPPEMESLLCDLHHGDEQEKEDASILCSCLATRGDGDKLLAAGVLTRLIALVMNGSENQKLWSAETLGTLASNNHENCVMMARDGAILPLIRLLQSGTDMQRQEAAYALGNLAADNDETRAEISREGAIPPLVAFVTAVTDAQNQWAVHALGALSLNNEANRVSIAQEGAISPLISLILAGTSAQKQWAAYTLGNLAYNDTNRVSITLEGAIAPLVKLLETGSDAQKQWAAYALGNLACDNAAIDEAMELDDAILPLVELVRTGSDPQKQEAAYTLGNLAAINDDNCDEIGREGAIAPLVELLRTGTSDQKQWAAYSLACIAQNNDANCADIVNEGAITPLVELVLTGTEDQKTQAIRTLGNLTSASVEGNNIPEVTSPLMGFLSSGISDENHDTIVHDGPISHVEVLSLNKSSDMQKQSGMTTLECLHQHILAHDEACGFLHSVAVA